METVLKIIGAIVLALIALVVAWHVLGWLSMLFYLAASLVVFGAIGYGIFLLLFGKKKASAPKVVKNFKLANAGSQVYIFRNEPAVKDLVFLNDQLHLAKLELSGDAFPVPEDTHVIVLQDDGKEAVKIRIKDKKRKYDSEGWVERSNLVAETKQITG
jgi:uncharacterized membrane protein YraQ (UPF0718 family)